MENITDVNTFTSPVTVVTDGDSVDGANSQVTAQALANRTYFLQQYNAGTITPAGVAATGPIGGTTGTFSGALSAASYSGPIIGINADATSGHVGEIKISSVSFGSPTTVANNTAVNICPGLVVPAGNWDLSGIVTLISPYAGNGALYGWISKNSNAQPSNYPDSVPSVYGELTSCTSFPASSSGGPNISVVIPQFYYVSSGSTTLYLGALAFLGASVGGYGFIMARRRV